MKRAIINGFETYVPKRLCTEAQQKEISHLVDFCRNGECSSVAGDRHMADKK